jgi:nitrite reductase/ring-hydroxylating ferredoxin subunit
MKPDQHHRLSRTGVGTDGGALLRHGWMPVALLDELQGAGAPYPMLPLRVLGQDLLLWRDALGRIGLIDRACPHRGTDLALGQHEGDGLRCALHGWKFDIDGHCLDMPAEPAGSPLCRRMRQRSYPLQQRAGMVFAWLGAADRPPDPLPALPALQAPDGHALWFKSLWRCNWLQALEMGLDPLAAQPHASLQLQVELPAAGLLRWTALRPMDDALVHVRIGRALCPHIVELPLSQTLTMTRWHAPVDDAHTAVYSLVCSFETPLDAQALPDDAFGQREQRLAESMGPVHGRAREHPASTDKAIVAYRRVLLKAMDALRFGDSPPSASAALQVAASSELEAIECLVPMRDWQRHCCEAVAARRERSAWLPA